MAPKVKPCGTRAGYFRHRREGESSCRPCLDAKNLYQREQARKSGVPAWKPARHGTAAGYHRHLRFTLDTPCESCRKAHNRQAWRWLKQDRKGKQRGSWRLIVEDYLGTFDAMTMAELFTLISEQHPDVKLETLQTTVKRLVDAGVVSSRADPEYGGFRTPPGIYALSDGLYWS